MILDGRPAKITMLATDTAGAKLPWMLGCLGIRPVAGIRARIAIDREVDNSATRAKLFRVETASLQIIVGWLSVLGSRGFLKENVYPLQFICPPRRCFDALPGFRPQVSW
jgi:hypothetical protein